LPRGRPTRFTLRSPFILSQPLPACHCAPWQASTGRRSPRLKPFTTALCDPTGARSVHQARVYAPTPPNLVQAGAVHHQVRRGRNDAGLWNENLDAPVSGPQPGRAPNRRLAGVLPGTTAGIQRRRIRMFLATSPAPCPRGHAAHVAISGSRR